MKEIESCDLCSNTTFKHLLQGEDRMYRKPGKFNLVECTNCTLAFVNPQPANIGDYYPESYYSFAGKHKRSKIAELMYRTFFSDSGNWFLRVLLYPLYPLIRSTRVLPGKRILDIGCGGGLFLSRMKQLGMEVYGVDPFTKEDIPELNVKKIRLEDAPFEDESFDVITMNNVLEHVENPNESFKHIARLLKKGGTAIIGVPNSKGLLFKFFGKHWSELDLPRHLFHFNKKTLTAYAKKHKLKVVKIRYNSVPFEISGSISYAIDWKNKKKLSQSLLASSRIIYWLCIPFCHLLILLKLGGRIEINLTKC